MRVDICSRGVLNLDFSWEVEDSIFTFDLEDFFEFFDMVEIKEKICDYLFNVFNFFVLNLVKNIGFIKVRDVNVVLIDLEM